MKQERPLLRKRLTAPKAAAIAGIVFSVLLIITLVLLLISIPTNPGTSGTWLSSTGNTILLALNLVPFSGIAFLWFIGVVRDRLGEDEDPFFATVFFGSGLLFLAMLFAFAAVTGGTILLYESQSNRLVASSYYDFGRSIADQIMHTYALKMAGVFMISTATLFIRTKVVPRWIALLGYVLALIMLLRINYIDRLGWVVLAFPLWILLISIHILIENYRRKKDSSATEP